MFSMITYLPVSFSCKSGLFKIQKLAGPCNGNDCELDQACLPKGMDYCCVPLPIHVSDSKFNIS